MGEVLKVLDANGYLQCSAFDVFGRLSAREVGGGCPIVGPCQPVTIDSLCDSTLAIYSFENVGLPGDIEDPQFLMTRTFDSARSSWRRYELFDGLGRVFQEEDEGRTSVGNEFDIRVRSWGPRGELACETLPLRGGPTVPLDCGATFPHREHTYDAAMRPLVTQRLVAASLVVPEISREYAVRNEDDLDGLEAVEVRTIRGTPGQTPDRRLEIARNARGQVVAVVDGEGTPALEARVLIRRDPKDRVLLVDSPDVVVTGSQTAHANLMAITYDGLDRRVKLVQPHSVGDLNAGPTWRFEWDANGNIARQTPPRGEAFEISFSYDELDRLEVKDYNPPGGPEDVIYTYDNPFNGKGRLWQVVTPAVTTTFGYFGNGWLESKIRSFPGAASFSFSYVYDQAGRITRTVFPDGEAVDREYDGSALVRLRSAETGKVFADAMSRHQSGGLDFISHPLASIQTDYTYDPDSLRVEQIRTTGASGTLADFTYSYDAASNLRSIDDSLGFLSEVFGYDLLHRLASAVGTGSSGYSSVAFAYDAAGNLTSSGPFMLKYGWTEPPRNCRRLHSLRGWSNGTQEQVLPGSS